MRHHSAPGEKPHHPNGTQNLAAPAIVPSPVFFAVRPFILFPCPKGVPFELSVDKPAKFCFASLCESVTQRIEKSPIVVASN